MGSYVKSAAESIKELSDKDKAYEAGRKSSKRRHLAAGVLTAAALAPVGAFGIHAAALGSHTRQHRSAAAARARVAAAHNRAADEITKATNGHKKVMKAYDLAQARKNFDKRYRKFKWRSTDGSRTVKPVWGITDAKRLLTGGKTAALSYVGKGLYENRKALNIGGGRRLQKAMRKLSKVLGSPEGYHPDTVRRARSTADYLYSRKPGMYSRMGSKGS